MTRSSCSTSDAGHDPTSVSLPVLPAPASTRIRASKNGPRRAAVLILVHLAFAAHLAHWLATGRTVSPVEPSESMRTLELGEVNAGAVFFAAAILATLVFGRFFCGWGCHIVALQDLCGWIMKRCGVRPKPFRSRLLVFIPLVLAVYMFAWPTVKREALAPVLRNAWPTVERDLGITPFPERGFTNHLMTEGFWDTFGPPWLAAPFLLVCGFATVYFLGAKGFCTYGCPYGGVFGPVDLVSPGKIVVDPARCHQCGHCTAVCTSNVRVHDEVREYGRVIDPGCMKCLDCVSVCPNGALSWGFATPTLRSRTPRTARPRRVYDTTRAEDAALALVFAAIFFATRGAYEHVAMLFAVGIAGCGTFLAWQAWRVLREANARHLSFQLKRRGRLTPAGAVFLALVALGAALTAHTGLVNYHRWRGGALTASLELSKPALLAPGATALDGERAETARRALGHLRRCASRRDGGLGLFTAQGGLLQRALLRLALGDPAGAERDLRLAVERFGPSDELVADLGRVVLKQGRTEEALALYAERLAAEPASWSVRESWSVLMVMGGRTAEAIADTERAIAAIPADGFSRTAHARTRLTLGRLYVAAGRGEEALTQVTAAMALRQDDPVMHENVAAIVLQTRGDAAMAIAAMRRAVELDPSATERRWRLALLLLQAGQGDEAAREFERAVRQEPAGSALRAEAARVLESAGRGGDAGRIRAGQKADHR